MLDNKCNCSNVWYGLMQTVDRSGGTVMTHFNARATSFNHIYSTQIVLLAHMSWSSLSITSDVPTYQLQTSQY